MLPNVPKASEATGLKKSTTHFISRSPGLGNQARVNKTLSNVTKYPYDIQRLKTRKGIKHPQPGYQYLNSKIMSTTRQFQSHKFTSRHSKATKTTKATKRQYPFLHLQLVLSYKAIEKAPKTPTAPPLYPSSSPTFFIYSPNPLASPSRAFLFIISTCSVNS